MSNTLTFYIIYTPGTVRYLLFFVESLLEWSDCAFRLVSNGCPEAEYLVLQQYCQQNARLSFDQVSTDICLPHGVVLNHLQAQNREPWFCFMDSDIYATGEFLSPFLPRLQQQVGIFSCAPIWCTAEEQILRPEEPVMMGEHNRSQEGRCLGGTYFAMYDNQAVTAVREATGVGFARCGWAELPARQQTTLTGLGLQKQYYDTGKALNLLLLAQEAELAFIESDHLQHIGGLSFIALKRLATPQPFHPYRFLQRVQRGAHRRLWQWLHPGAQQAPSPTFSQRRHQYGSYYSELLRALDTQHDLPSLPTLGLPLLDAQMATSAQEIRKLYTQWQHKPNHFAFTSSTHPAP